MMKGFYNSSLLTRSWYGRVYAIKAFYR